MAGNGTAGKNKKLETAIGYILRAGVATSASIVLIGGIAYLRENAFTVPDYHAFTATARYSRDLSGIIHNALRLNSVGIIQLGLLVLVATPIARVVFSAVSFALERDFVYMAVSMLVLAVLLYSLFGHV